MAGVSATDDIDGDLTDKIKVEGTVTPLESTTGWSTP